MSAVFTFAGLVTIGCAILAGACLFVWAVIEAWQKYREDSRSIWLGLLLFGAFALARACFAT